MILNSDIVKYVVVLGSAPLWLPFARALWQELRDAFEEEGGLFGEDPGPVHRARIREERARRPDPLVHEPLAAVRLGARREDVEAARGGNVRAPGPSRAGRGFRS